MESRIKIKANINDMQNLFEGSEIMSIRYYEQTRKDMFDTIVRHKELKDYLKGTYTIDQLENILK